MSWRDAFAELCAGYPDETARPAMEIADRIAALFPDMTPAVRSGWQAVTFRHARAGYVCGVFLTRHGARLIFEHGAEMSDPEILLEGETRQVRHIPVFSGRQIADPVLLATITEAISLRS